MNFVVLKWAVLMQIELPFAVTSEGARATLDIKHQTLRLELPFRPFKDVLAEVRKMSVTVRYSSTVCWFCAGRGDQSNSIVLYHSVYFYLKHLSSVLVALADASRIVGDYSSEANGHCQGWGACLAASRLIGRDLVAR